MSDSTNSGPQPNPFAAPQVAPGTQADQVLDDAYLLSIAEVECSRMRVWVWLAGLMFVGFSLITMLILLVILLDQPHFFGVISSLVFLCLHGCASVLFLRCASKITEFRSLPRPFQFEEVFLSHAACWRYLAIVSAVLLVIFTLLLID